jgi:hypothetical protein
VAAILTDVMRSVPGSAPFLASRLAKLLDLPDAEELASELKTLNPAFSHGGQGSAGMAQIQQRLAELQRLREENATLQAQARDKSVERQIELQKIAIEQYRAQTERLKVTAVPLPG